MIKELNFETDIRVARFTRLHSTHTSRCLRSSEKCQMNMKYKRNDVNIAKYMFVTSIKRCLQMPSMGSQTSSIQRNTFKSSWIVHPSCCNSPWTALLSTKEFPPDLSFLLFLNIAQCRFLNIWKNSSFLNLMVSDGGGLSGVLFSLVSPVDLIAPPRQFLYFYQRKDKQLIEL